MSSTRHGRFLGVSIGTDSLDSITAASLQAIDKAHPPITFSCANPHSLVEAQNDPEFMEALNNSNIVVADGVGVTMLANVASIDVGPRITGEDYFFSIMNTLNNKKIGKVYFFGSSSAVLNAICARTKRDFPHITVCGTFSPPYREWSESENASMIKAINAAEPDVLWVGMTAPKQEKWVARNRERLLVPVVGSIGAVFDFYAGTHPRAPRIMCKMGLEWLYRLAREPKRMWRRNFISTPKFVLLTLWHHIINPQNRL